jgi:DNA repair exonuclease SbcCD ATPase subunit
MLEHRNILDSSAGSSPQKPDTNDTELDQLGPSLTTDDEVHSDFSGVSASTVSSTGQQFYTAHFSANNTDESRSGDSPTREITDTLHTVEMMSPSSSISSVHDGSVHFGASSPDSNDESSGNYKEFLSQVASLRHTLTVLDGKVFRGHIKSSNNFDQLKANLDHIEAKIRELTERGKDMSDKSVEETLYDLQTAVKQQRELWSPEFFAELKFHIGKLQNLELLYDGDFGGTSVDDNSLAEVIQQKLSSEPERQAKESFTRTFTKTVENPNVSGNELATTDDEYDEEDGVTTTTKTQTTTTTILIAKAQQGDGPPSLAQRTMSSPRLMLNVAKKNQELTNQVQQIQDLQQEHTVGITTIKSNLEMCVRDITKNVQEMNTFLNRKIETVNANIESAKKTWNELQAKAKKETADDVSHRIRTMESVMNTSIDSEIEERKKLEQSVIDRFNNNAEAMSKFSSHNDLQVFKQEMSTHISVNNDELRSELKRDVSVAIEKSEESIMDSVKSYNNDLRTAKAELEEKLKTFAQSAKNTTEKHAQALQHEYTAKLSQAERNIGLKLNALEANMHSSFNEQHDTMEREIMGTVAKEYATRIELATTIHNQMALIEESTKKDLEQWVGDTEEKLSRRIDTIAAKEKEYATKADLSIFDKRMHLDEDFRKDTLRNLERRISDTDTKVFDMSASLVHLASKTEMDSLASEMHHMEAHGKQAQWKLQEQQQQIYQRIDTNERALRLVEDKGDRFEDFIRRQQQNEEFNMKQNERQQERISQINDTMNKNQLNNAKRFEDITQEITRKGDQITHRIIEDLDDRVVDLLRGESQLSKQIKTQQSEVEQRVEKKLNEQTNAITSRVERSVNSIEELKTKIVSLETESNVSLDELAQATNLRIVNLEHEIKGERDHSREQFQTEINRIDSIEQRIDHLTGDIQQRVKDSITSQENKVQNQIQTIEAQVQRANKNLEQQVNITNESVNNKLADTQRETKKSLLSLAEELKMLRDSNNSTDQQIQDSFTETLNQTRELVESNISDLDAKIASQIESQNERVDKLYDVVQGQHSQIEYTRSDVKGLRTLIEQNKTLAANQVADAKVSIQGVQNSVLQLKDQVDDKIRDAELKIQQNVSLQTQQVLDVSSSRISTLSEDVQKNRNTLESSLVKLEAQKRDMHDIQTASERATKMLSEKVEQNQTYNLTRFSQIESQSEQLKDYVLTVERSIQEHDSQQKQYIDSLNNTTLGMVSVIDNQVGNVIKQLEDQREHLITTTSTIDSVRSDTHQQIRSIREVSEERTRLFEERMESVNKHVLAQVTAAEEQLQRHNESAIHSVTNELAAKIEELKQTQEQTESQLDTKLAENHNSVRSLIEQRTANAEDTLKSYVNNKTAGLSDDISIVRSNIEEARRSLDLKIDTQRAIVEEMIASSSSENDERIRNISHKVQGATDDLLQKAKEAEEKSLTIITSINKTLRGLVDDVKVTVDENAKETNTKLSQVNKRHDELENMIEQVDKHHLESVAKLERNYKALDEQQNETNANVNKLQGHFEQQLEEQSNRINSSIDTLKSDLSRTQENVQVVSKELNNVRESFDERIRSTEEVLHQNISTRLESTSSSTEDRFSAIGQTLHQLQSNLDKEIVKTEQNNIATAAKTQEILQQIADLQEVQNTSNTNNESYKTDIEAQLRLMDANTAKEVKKVSELVYATAEQITRNNDAFTKQINSVQEQVKLAGEYDETIVLKIDELQQSTETKFAEMTESNLKDLTTLTEALDERMATYVSREEFATTLDTNLSQNKEVQDALTRSVTEKLKQTTDQYDVTLKSLETQQQITDERIIEYITRNDQRAVNDLAEMRAHVEISLKTQRKDIDERTDASIEQNNVLWDDRVAEILTKVEQTREELSSRAVTLREQYEATANHVKDYIQKNDANIVSLRNDLDKSQEEKYQTTNARYDELSGIISTNENQNKNMFAALDKHLAESVTSLQNHDAQLQRLVQESEKYREEFTMLDSKLDTLNATTEEKINKVKKLLLENSSSEQTKARADALELISSVEQMQMEIESRLDGFTAETQVKYDALNSEIFLLKHDSENVSATVKSNHEKTGHAITEIAKMIDEHNKAIDFLGNQNSAAKDRMSILDTKVDTIQSEAAILLNNLEQKSEKELEQVKQELNTQVQTSSKAVLDISSRLNTLSMEIENKLQNNMQQLATSLEDLKADDNTSTERLETNIQKIDEQLKSMAAQNTSSSARFDQTIIEYRNLLNEQIDNVQHAIQSQNEDVQTIKARMSNMDIIIDENLETSARNLFSLEQRIDNLPTFEHLEKVVSNIDTLLQTRISAQQFELTEVNTRIKELYDDAVGIKRVLNETSESIGSLNSSVTKVEKLGETISTLDDKLNTSVATTEERFDAINLLLSREVKEVSSRVESAEKNVESKIATLSDEQKRFITQFEENVNNTTKRVSDASSRLEVVENEIRQEIASHKNEIASRITSEFNLQYNLFQTRFDDINRQREEIDTSTIDHLDSSIHQLQADKDQEREFYAKKLYELNDKIEQLHSNGVERELSTTILDLQDRYEKDLSEMSSRFEQMLAKISQDMNNRFYIQEDLLQKMTQEKLELKQLLDQERNDRRKLASQVDQLRTAVNKVELVEQVQKSIEDEQVQHLQRIESVEKKVDTSVVEQNDNTSRLASLSNKVNDLSEKVSSGASMSQFETFETSLRKTATDIGNLTKQLDKTDKKTSKYISKVEKDVTGRLTTVEKNVSKLEQEQHASDTKTQQIEKKQGENLAGVEKVIKERIAGLETKVQNSTKHLEKLQNDLLKRNKSPIDESYITRINDVETRMDVVEDSTKLSLQKVEQKLEQVTEGYQEHVAEKVGGLAHHQERQIETVLTQVKDLSEKLQDVNEFKPIYQKIEEHETKLGDLEEKVEQDQESIQNIEARLEQDEQTLDEHGNKIEKDEERVGELETWRDSLIVRTSRVRRRSWADLLVLIFVTILIAIVSMILFDYPSVKLLHYGTPPT